MLTLGTQWQTRRYCPYPQELFVDKHAMAQPVTMFGCISMRCPLTRVTWVTTLAPSILEMSVWSLLFQISLTFNIEVCLSWYLLVPVQDAAMVMSLPGPMLQWLGFLCPFPEMVPLFPLVFKSTKRRTEEGINKILIVRIVEFRESLFFPFIYIFQKFIKIHFL